MEYKFSMDNFEKEVLNSSEPVLVDFFATWCGVCEKEGPIITELAEEYTGKVKIGKLDVDENTMSARFPTWSFSKTGKSSTGLSVLFRLMY